MIDTALRITKENEADVREGLNKAIYRLSQDSSITQARKLGDARIHGLNQTQVNQLRYKAKNDLFFLSHGILGYDKISVDLHGSVCAWMMRNRQARFRELLLPRGHYKTTIWTIADGVRIALPGDNGIWPESLGTEVRILLAHEAKLKAEQFLVAIAGHYLSNPLLMALFPEVVPSPRIHRINKSELELPRQGIWPEATYSTMGTGGRSQGLHFNFLKLDDLIGDEARDSKSVMSSAKEWFDNIQAFFSSFTEDHLDLAGTRWAFDDLYGHVHTQYESLMLKYIRGAEEMVEVVGKSGEKIKELAPIFPWDPVRKSGFKLKDFEVLKKNKRIWSAQYANNPESGATEFDSSWLMFYEWVDHNELRFERDDNSGYRAVEDMDVVILIDPAMSGLGGIVVTGMDNEGNVFLLETIKEEWNPPDVVDLVFKLVQRWKPRLVVFEKVLFSGLFEYWIKDRMTITGVSFKIESLGVGKIEKEARVRGLANYLAANQIFAHKHKQEDFVLEVKQFGATENIHLLDSLAQGPKVWRKGLNRRRMEEMAQGVEHIQSNRDSLTGYSRIRTRRK